MSGRLAQNKNLVQAEGIQKTNVQKSNKHRPTSLTDRLVSPGGNKAAGLKCAAVNGGSQFRVW